MPENPGSTGAPYNLPWPGDTNVADVPEDIKKLAEKTAEGLNGKLSTQAASSAYQPLIVIGTELPASPTANMIFFKVSS